MEAAKAAVARHTSRTGHRTNVEEMVRPAVTRETVKPHRHEVITEAVDREIHQHHHHTTVLPLSHKETLPIKHTHNLMPVKMVHHQHEDEAETKRTLADMAAHFRDMSVTMPVTHSKTHAPQVVGEHYHHHIHEVVQPLIYKETIQPEHVHTTIPIHETHHAKAEHHGMSALPMKQLHEFLDFHKDRSPDHVTRSTYDGPPRPYDSKLSTTLEKIGLHSHRSPTHSNDPMGHSQDSRPLNSHNPMAHSQVPGPLNSNDPMMHSRAPEPLNSNGPMATSQVPGPLNSNDPMSHSRVPEPLNVNTTPRNSNARLLQRKPTPPKSPPGLEPHRQRRTHRHTITGRSGSVSSLSSASSSFSSVPSTPNSPSHHGAGFPRTTTTVTSPMHTVTSGPLNHHTTINGPDGTNITTDTNTSTVFSSQPRTSGTPPNAFTSTTPNRTPTHHTNSPLPPLPTTTPTGNRTPNNNSIPPVPPIPTNTTNNINRTPSNNNNNTTTPPLPPVPTTTNMMNTNTNTTRAPVTPIALPNKHSNATEPVRIMDADESPRSSDEGYPTRQRGSFMSRLNRSISGRGNGNTATTPTRRY